MKVRKLIGPAVLFCAAAAVLLAQSKIVPMNVKTGLWESTSTVNVSGTMGIPPEAMANLTPEQRARAEAAMSQYNKGHHGQTTTSKGCLTQDQLTKNPFEEKNVEGMKCTAKLLRSSASDAEVEEVCTGQEGSSADIHMTFHAVDREHVTGTGHVTATMGGHTMKSDMSFQSKWLQDSCPADAN